MVIGALLLTVILVQYTLTYLFLKEKLYSAFMALLIGSFAFYDFLYIEASYWLPNWFVSLAKLHTEYVTIYFGLRLLRRGRHVRIYEATTRHLVLLLLVPSLAVIAINDLGYMVKRFDLLFGLRLFITPILLCYLLLHNGVFRAVRGRHILNCIIVVTVVAGLSGLIQKNYFYTVRDLWFFDYFNHFPKNPVLVGFANYIRNDKLRMTGFFVSPIAQALTLGVGIQLVAARLLYSGRRLSEIAFLVVVIAFLIYCQYGTFTRVGMIMDVLGVTILLGSRILKTGRKLLYALPTLAVLATFALLLVGGTTEVSALGRLGQYVEFVQRFQFKGLGFAHQFVSTYFDSYYISLMLLFGLAVMGPVIYLYKLNRNTYRLVEFQPGQEFAQATFAITATFIYVFAFQFVAGSIPYRLYFLLLFYCLYQYEDRIRKQTLGADLSSRLQTTAE
jgi:hypothetical protein